MNERYVYIVRPLGSDLEVAAKGKLIERVLNRAHLRAVYPARCEHEAGFDLSFEISAIETSEFCLVDLSFERPSCYFELGIIEALGKKVVLVAASGTSIHQTSNRPRVTFYKAIDDFENVLETLIEDVLKQ
jgi:hypothetical protein